MYNQRTVKCHFRSGEIDISKTGTITYSNGNKWIGEITIDGKPNTSDKNGVLQYKAKDNSSIYYLKEFGLLNNKGDLEPDQQVNLYTSPTENNSKYTKCVFKDGEFNKVSLENLFYVIRYNNPIEGEQDKYIEKLLKAYQKKDIIAVMGSESRGWDNNLAVSCMIKDLEQLRNGLKTLEINLNDNTGLIVDHIHQSVKESIYPKFLVKIKLKVIKMINLVKLHIASSKAEGTVFWKTITREPEDQKDIAKKKHEIFKQICVIESQALDEKTRAQVLKSGFDKVAQVAYGNVKEGMTSLCQSKKHTTHKEGKNRF